MEERRFEDRKEPEIVYSHSVKAGICVSQKAKRNSEVKMKLRNSKNIKCSYTRKILHILWKDLKM